MTEYTCPICGSKSYSSVTSMEYHKKPFCLKCGYDLRKIEKEKKGK